jgi:hypothetical protein
LQSILDIKERRQVAEHCGVGGSGGRPSYQAEGRPGKCLRA